MHRSSCLLVFFSLFIIGPAHAETLGEVLSRQDMSGYLNDVAANQQITSFSVHQDREAFLLAYYKVRNSDPVSLSDTLNLLLIDQGSGQVSHDEIFLPDILSNSHLSSIGSIVSIQKIDAYYFLKGHLNPSVSPTLVLSRDLQVYDVLPGWIVAIDARGDIILQNNMIHFAQPRTPQFTLYNLQNRTHKLMAAPLLTANPDDI